MSCKRSDAEKQVAESDIAIGFSVLYMIRLSRFSVFALHINRKTSSQDCQYIDKQAINEDHL